MRSLLPWLVATAAGTMITARAWAQAGEYIPPIEPMPIGGGHVPFVPFIHWPVGGGDSVGCWLVLALAAAVVVLVAGVRLGHAVGRRFASRPPQAGHDRPTGAAPVPAMDALILSVSEVVAKAEKTEELLQQLASRDPLFEPTNLRDGLGRLFHLVQQCWQARDYGPLHSLLTPGILAKHEALLLSMRLHTEINRVEEVRITRFEFVHVFCPCDAGRQEVTALITFEARVYFVNEVTSAFLRGSGQVGLYQEFWTFRRQECAWRLQTIEQSHESGRLQAENHVEVAPAGSAPDA
jgi:Tim44-like domain